MKWKKEKLDVILVPIGILMMFGYHLWLLFKYLRNSKSTVIGFENHCQRVWVCKLMQIDAMNRGPAFTVMNSTIVAANFMASTSLTLSSLMGTWIASSSNSETISIIIYGDTGSSIIALKYISILLFFLLAFACFIQSSRCYVQANLLLSMPKAQVPEDLAVDSLINGRNFWQVGLRAVYFAITMLMWIFGPIPMVLSSGSMVAVLYVLDSNTKYLLPDFSKPSVSEDKKRKRFDERFEQHEMDVGSSELQVNAAINAALLSAAAI